MTASATPYTDILTALEASSLTDQPPHAAWVRAKQSEDAFLALAKDMEAYSETYAPPVRLAFKLVFENNAVSIQSHHFETEQKSAHERLTDAANAPAFTSMHAFVEALSLHPIYGKVFVGEKPERITVSYNGETFMVYLEIPSHDPDERATLLVINDSLFSPP